LSTVKACGQSSGKMDKRDDLKNCCTNYLARCGTWYTSGFQSRY